MSEFETARADDPAVSISVQSLLDERLARHESALQQPAGSGLWTGNFRGARRGHGTDFDDLRHYSPGDDLRHIDWNASARTNKLHTRLYREEREHRVTLITDLRSSMFTGTQELRSVRACRLAARLLWQAVDGGSRTSVIVVCDAGILASEYGNGHRAAIEACGLLARCFHDVRGKIESSGQSASLGNSFPETEQTPTSSMAQTVNPGMNSTLQRTELPDPSTHQDVLITLPAYQSEGAESQLACDQVAHWLSAQRQLHGSVIWVSAFDHLGEDFNKAMDDLSQATRQIAIHVDDEMLDHGLPAGRYGYRTGDSTNRTSHAVSVSRKQGIRLHRQLLMQKQQRIARFSDLLIPMLNTDTGNTEIVTALRRSGHLP